jgi:D-alanyl-D-alanine carboxypeptidase
VLKFVRYILALSLVAFWSAAIAFPAPAHAGTQTTKSSKQAKTTKASSKKTAKRAPTKERPDDRYAALVVDASTGKVIYQKNAGSLRYPASLTKMMTLYLTFDALRSGYLKINSSLPVSAKAAAQPQTNISLKPGEYLPVKLAIESLVVRSANDSAVVLAEAIGKTEWNFALMMTQKARELGMKHTIFRNPSGLPDAAQHTTAYDMARLAIALRRDFPDYYHYFKTSEFTHKGVRYTGHNRVMARYDGVDGVKTGYIRASGFNLVTSARKDGMNLVAVVMGGRTAQARDDEMISLLNRSFAELANQRRNNVAGDQRSEGLFDAASSSLIMPASLSHGELAPSAGLSSSSM